MDDEQWRSAGHSFGVTMSNIASIVGHQLSAATRRPPTCYAMHRVWDECGYSPIDLESYGRGAVTLSGALIRRRTVKYCKHSRPPTLSRYPETTHTLCHASYMMWDECGYSPIDLESYGRWAVRHSFGVTLSNIASIVGHQLSAGIRRPPTCYAMHFLWCGASVDTAIST
jgi:hypothetical protein